MRRLGSLEALRILAAVGIVWFHAPGTAFDSVAYGGLSVFLILSTMFVSQRRVAFGPTVLRRARTLLVPWIGASLIFLAFDAARGSIGGDPLAMVLMGPRMHLWYLPFAFVVAVGFTAVAGRGPRAGPAVRAGLWFVIFTGLAWAAVHRSGLVPGTPVPEWLYALPAVALGRLLSVVPGVASVRRRLGIAAIIAGLTIGVLLVLPLDRPFVVSYASAIVAIAVCLRWTGPGPSIVDWLSRQALPVYLFHPLWFDVLWKLGVDRERTGLFVLVGVVGAIAMGEVMARIPGLRLIVDPRSKSGRTGPEPEPEPAPDPASRPSSPGGDPVAGGTAVVVIGRDEVSHLAPGLDAIAAARPAGWTSVIYADSGSTDGSPELAEAHPAVSTVVRLDPARAFSAARGRNEGAAAARSIAPDLGLIQFVDGDCTLAPDWADAAEAALRADPGLAVVCGRIREERARASLWSRVMDLELDRPAGPIDACGGIFMIRAEAFDAVGGFDDRLAAGEEPELCLRLRRAGWRLARLDAEMARHDADLRGFGDWWRRTVRSGRAYETGRALHGTGPEQFCVADVRRIWIWAAAIPTLILLAGLAWTPLVLAAFAVYPLQVARIAWRERRRGPAGAILQAVAVTVAKVPQLVGIVTAPRLPLPSSKPGDRPS